MSKVYKKTKKKNNKFYNKNNLMKKPGKSELQKRKRLKDKSQKKKEDKKLKNKYLINLSVKVKLNPMSFNN